MCFGELSLGLRIQESTIPNHEIRKALHIRMVKQIQGERSFHMHIIFSKAKQIYGISLKWPGEKDPEKFLLSKYW